MCLILVYVIKCHRHAKWTPAMFTTTPYFIYYKWSDRALVTNELLEAT